MNLPTAGLLIAFALFASIVAWIFVVPKARWQQDARLPLEGDSATDKDKHNG